MVKATLEQILKEHGLSKDHLSPYLRKTYSLSTSLYYVPHRKPTEAEKKREEELWGAWRSFCKGRKSLGEMWIAEYLESRGIEFRYERKLVLAEGQYDTVHVRFPDFYLPEYRLFIEFNGSEGMKGEDLRYTKKDEAYIKNRVRYTVIHKKERDEGTWKAKIDAIIREEEAKSIFWPFRLFDWLASQCRRVGYTDNNKEHYDT